MNLHSIDDPRAMGMLNSMVLELGALEAATGRLRAQLDTLLKMLTAASPADDDAEEASYQASASGAAGEPFVAPIASEQAEVSQSDVVVIGLSAGIEASVAEFAGAAEVGYANVESEDAVELMLEAVTDAADEIAAAVEEPAGNEPDTAAGEALAPTGVSEDRPAAGGSQEVSPPVGGVAAKIDADTANSDGVDEAATVAADGAPPADKVVVLELKRRVWPQRLAACASILLIAAAAVVMVDAMPDMIGFTI